MNKKMLSILCALSLIALAGPAFAGPGGPGGESTNASMSDSFNDTTTSIDANLDYIATYGSNNTESADASMSDSFNETTSIDADVDYTGTYGSNNTKSETETLSVTKNETEVEDSFNDKTVTIENTDNSVSEKTVTIDDSDNSVYEKTSSFTSDSSDNSVSEKTVTVTETYRKSENKIENSYNTANVQDNSINIEAALVQSAALTIADGGAFQSAFGGEDLSVENSIELDDALNGWSGVSNNAQSAGSFNNNGIMNVIAVGRDLIP